MDYHLIYSKRKTISLSVKKDTTVVVRAPIGLSKSTIDKFVQAHISWIIKHQTKMKEKQKLRENFHFQDGEYLPFLGDQYPIVSGEKSFFDGNYLVLPPGEEEERKTAYFSILSSYAKTYFNERVDFFSPLVGKKPLSIRITKARTRWGSCGTNQRINFSCRLLCLEKELIDYVVVHELCHLLEHNHSKRFYNQVHRVLADASLREQKLKQITLPF